MQSIARVFNATKLSGRSFTGGRKTVATSSSKAAKPQTLASSSLRKARAKKITSRAYCSATGFAVPVITEHDPLPKLAHSVRPVGDDGFTRVTPHQLYVDIREGVSVLMVDIRPKAEFDIYHILGCYNCPAATFTASDIEDLAWDRPVYILTGGVPANLKDAVQVANIFKSKGHFTNIVDAGLKVFPDVGFMYYMDVDAEEARLKAVEAAKAAAAAGRR